MTFDNVLCVTSKFDHGLSNINFNIILKLLVNNTKSVILKANFPRHMSLKDR